MAGEGSALPGGGAGTPLSLQYAEIHGTLLIKVQLAETSHFLAPSTNQLSSPAAGSSPPSPRRGSCCLRSRGRRWVTRSPLPSTAALRQPDPDHAGPAGCSRGAPGHLLLLRLLTVCTARHSPPSPPPEPQQGFLPAEAGL